MRFKEHLVEIVGAGILIIGCSSLGVWCAESNRVTEKDLKIKEINAAEYYDAHLRELEISEVEKECAFGSKKEVYNKIWDAGVGALIGTLIYGGLKLGISMPYSNNKSDSDDGSNWSRTSGEYPTGFG